MTALLRRLHHVAIIAGDYRRSKTFYHETLGLPVIREIYRAERQSWKLDLAIGPDAHIELFSFPDPPARATRPAARGLRHLAFAVDDLDTVIARLNCADIVTEPVRVDEHTGARFAFFADPDGLPLELYESPA